MGFPGGIEQRAAGVLLHPTSLPGPGATGRLDGRARAFVDWLAAAGFRVWQMLPTGPVDDHACPYQPPSAFAGDTRLLDPDGPSGGDGLEKFRTRNAAWIDDWTLFAALRQALGRPWWQWPADLRDRDPGALARAREVYAAAIEAETRDQCRFEHQWSALRDYAAAQGVLLFGDLPLYCAHDSADAWANRGLFALDEGGGITGEAGVPPDAFSDTGQHWGQPLHDWDAQAADGWRWWIERLRVMAARFDLLRIDHFRGFCAAWSIPAGAEDARVGHWVPGPGRAPFDAIRDDLGELPLIAEDLGTITDDVQVLRDDLGLPGMRVLQFAFDGGDDNPHRPEHHPEWSVAYTGTHDNDTALGWWRGLDEETRARVCAELATDDHGMPGPLIDSVLHSRARLAMLPLQDLLGLGSEARMNVPGRRAGNWCWRFREGALDTAPASAWRDRLATAGRPGAPQDP
ncbi:MAG: 4-alpha-glucanotransferase [Halofilum sp. (in: g-proteobacteria)]|nr:4-alpha-glucanotransferase [Halofilum sp. (in: g-proteobacteria)]